MIPNTPEHQAKIDKIRGLVKDQDDWIGMYIIAFERAEKYENALERIARILPMGNTFRERECWVIVKEVLSA